VFIDECGSNTAMTREHAWAQRGSRAHEAVPRNRGTVTTIIGALTVDGLEAAMTIEGGTSGEVFAAFVEHVLIPVLKPGDLVVMDNLAAHKTALVRELLRSAGARPVWLPPYSPEMNPIELAWAKLKAFIKDCKARSVQALELCVAMAMKWLITPDEAQAWIRHCGYPALPA